MSFTHAYLLYGLEASPVVLSSLMSRATEEKFDYKSKPDRFSTREVIAHLADLEELWVERIEKIKAEEGVELQGQDPDEAAKQNNYAESDPAATLKRYVEGRAKVVAALKELPAESWSRYGNHAQAGKITIHDIAQFVLGHDGYHLQQIAEYVDAAP